MHICTYATHHQKVAKSSAASWVGNGKIPYLDYRDCSNELAEVVANIVNMSVGDGIVPAAWRTAVIYNSGA